MKKKLCVSQSLFDANNWLRVVSNITLSPAIHGDFAVWNGMSGELARCKNKRLTFFFFFFIFPTPRVIINALQYANYDYTNLYVLHNGANFVFNILLDSGP
jgi:hypothetical protein